MCGIFSVFLRDGLIDSVLREKAFQLSRRQRHRGPDSTGVQSGKNFCIVQERLSIIGIATGRQPLLSADGDVILAANGEIYNYKELAEIISNRRGIAYTPRSDSDVIMALYEEFGKECASMLWGMFGFVIFNKKTSEIFAARDGLGVCTLYYGVDQGRLFIASEMKCIPCDKVSIFPPGHYLQGTPDRYEMVEYYKPQWSSVNTLVADLAEIRRRLELSVQYHLSAEVPLACFLSGGVNSSIIAAVTQKLMLQSGAGKLKTFTVAMQDSTDLIFARDVAEYLGTDHTEILFTAEDGLDLIPELIWHLETYDPFAIRSAIPMYILSRSVRSAGVKVILSGEGADEIFGGYSYFNSAPSSEEFRQETIKKLLDAHLSDGLRANKTSMAQSVELRAPFLGSPFVNYAMNIRSADRMPKQRDFLLATPAEVHEQESSLSPEEKTTASAPVSRAFSTPLADDVSTTIGSHLTSVSEMNSKVDYDSDDGENATSTHSQITPVSERAADGKVTMNSSHQSSDTSEGENTSYDKEDQMTCCSTDSSPPIEKWLLRKACEDLVPEHIIWRQKEQFSDGVGSQWVGSLQRHAEERVSDTDFAQASQLYPHNTPTTKEEFLYRRIFDMEYPGDARARTVVMWKPNWVDYTDDLSPDCFLSHWRTISAQCHPREASVNPREASVNQ